MIRFFQGLFASMSLERKCLLFFGSAVVVLMFLAFLIVEKLGRELVENTTRSRARDYSDAEMLRLHSRAVGEGSNPEVLDELRRLLLSEEGNRDTAIEHEFLGPVDPVRYDNLPPRHPGSRLVDETRTNEPSRDLIDEDAVLRRLEFAYRNKLARQIA
ncbi:two-component sensor histidine kinase, partial [Rubripirellula amarantea]|nr:two-component sensor histidine kinase [Rubripirellula amarantea]